MYFFRRFSLRSSRCSLVWESFIWRYLFLSAALLTSSFEGLAERNNYKGTKELAKYGYYSIYPTCAKFQKIRIQFSFFIFSYNFLFTQKLQRSLFELNDTIKLSKRNFTDNTFAIYFFRRISLRSSRYSLVSKTLIWRYIFLSADLLSSCCKGIPRIQNYKGVKKLV